ncbi:diguanylate cyclase [Aeromonas dhakensis]|uniref:diguanylate cyclase n=1 Tax=Aeromonas dhakensis TaxID=196024 RepID=UPI000A7CC922|nr:diguanylate cyclase [Aeromonas dhakensis]UCM45183.1 diguanylate cyclase [Aeromonas dhakensis]
MIRTLWEAAWATPQKFTILVVDDEPIFIQLIFALLKDQHRIVMATSGEDALDVCRKIKPDLVLMDVMMEGLTGLDVCKIITNAPDLSDIPVIFLTSLSGEDDEMNCWNAGCADFIAKPFHQVTLFNRIKSQLKIKYQKELLKLASYTDAMTGIHNRLYLSEELPRLLLQTARDSLALSVLMLDVDFFKQYNDTYGHLAGDDALKQVAKTLKNCCARPLDLIARFGGEEFVIVLPSTDANGAALISTRIHQEIQGLDITHCASQTSKLTVSIGCLSIRAGKASTDEVLFAADKLLYEAKATGRSKTVFGTI